MTRKTGAFTFIDLLMLVFVLAIAAAVILPMMARPRTRMRTNCTTNLKQLGLSFKTWAIDNEDRYPMELSHTNGGTLDVASNWLAWVHFPMMSNELSTPKILVCPRDPARTAATNFTSDFNNQHLSYFVNLDAKDGPGNIILSGDRNLSFDGQVSKRLLTVKTNSALSWTASIHTGQGNVLMADGSVQQVSSAGLRSLLTSMPPEGARLALP